MALIQMKFYSPSLQTKTNLNLLVPTPESTLTGTQETFADCRKMGPLPVLYLLHGTSGDEGDWLRFSRIEDYARKYRLLVAMPSCENSCYRDTPAGKAYYTYVTKELPQFLGWLLPVSEKREDTYIAGLSMGGSGAFMLGMSRPSQYGYVACLSGGFNLPEKVEAEPKNRWSWAFGPDETLIGTRDDAFWLSSRLVEEKADYPELYLCCGTEDFLYEKNCELKRHLDAIGFRHVYHEQPGAHDWNFWDDEIRRVLQWLPVKKKDETEYL
ncbi:MAG: esterase family protein [Lachnospiraceae bacterium]|nr:esterase family protein [Lachnospiraceae bacterium]